METKPKKKWLPYKQWKAQQRREYQKAHPEVFDEIRKDVELAKRQRNSRLYKRW